MKARAMLAMLVLAGMHCWQAARADDAHTPRPGLWSFAMSLSAAPSAPNHAQLCTDAGTVGLIAKMSQGLNTAACAKSEPKTSGDTTTSDVECRFGTTTVSSHTVVVSSGDTRYHAEATMHYDPPSAGLSDSTLTTDAEWLGPCKEGMEPGDFTTNGTTVNINSMTGVAH